MKQSTSGIPSISVVLPAFNESAVIADVITCSVAALQKNNVSEAEIVVIDDGSDDDTGSHAMHAGADLAYPVRVIRHRRNRGYGAALRTGFEAARFDAVWLMDSDAQFDPADLSHVLAHYGPRCAVYCYRLKRRDTMLRRANHAAFFVLVRVLFGPSVRDVNCAFKLFPRELGIGLVAAGAVISTELVLRTRRSGYDVVEIGVPHYPRRAGKATGANPRVVLLAFVELYRLWRRRASLTIEARPDAR